MAEIRTVCDMFAAWHGSEPEPALVDAREGRFERWTAAEVVRRVAGLAKGLRRIGVGPGDRVALLCGDRPEWHVVDFATLHLAAADVPVYPTLQAPQVRPILADSGATVAIAENAEQLAKLREVKSTCAALRHLVVIDGAKEEGVWTLAELTEPVSQTEAVAFLAECARAISPDTLATLIYTSGTTGEPKGVMLTHDNFTFDAVTGAEVLPWPDPPETALVFLPLSHVLERLGDYVYFVKGISLAYCGILESAEAMRRVRPHMFTAVPRFYEKVYDRIMHEVAAAPPAKRAIFRAAVRTAVASVRTGRRTLAWRLYDVLVYRKIRAALGGRIRFSISGGAPLPVFVGEFFHGIGIRLLEGYGLTETSPVVSVNTFDRLRLGTVGPPLPGVDVQIADDGEVRVRGRLVMRGYWNRPEATAAAIDADGWLSTGDIGVLDADGFLAITDRKKDLLVTAGGKNVAPQPIENLLKADPLVETVVLFGDRQPYIVALIVPSADALRAWAAARGFTASGTGELCALPEVVAEYRRILDAVNAGLARFETVKKFRLVPEPFTIAAGELTPTLKVKRKVVGEHWAAQIAEMYRENAGS